MQWLLSIQRRREFVKVCSFFVRTKAQHTFWPHGANFLVRSRIRSHGNYLLFFVDLGRNCLQTTEKSRRYRRGGHYERLSGVVWQLIFRDATFKMLILANISIKRKLNRSRDQRRAVRMKFGDLFAIKTTRVLFVSRWLTSQSVIERLCPVGTRFSGLFLCREGILVVWHAL